MIHDQDLTMFLWAKAANIAVYVQNRSRHRTLEDKIPKEAFIQVKPKVSHLRFFGCLVYIHVLKGKKKMLKH